MTKKETAEQKLAKIIAASQKAKGLSTGTAPDQVVKKSSVIAIGIQHINYLLILAVLASMAYFGYEVQNGMTLVQQSISITARASKRNTAVSLFTPNVKNIAHYLKKIQKRSVFLPHEQKDAEPQDASPAQASIEKKLQKYKMVGVAWLDLPESATAMVEDTATGATRFLKEGDKLEDVTLKAIYTDKIVFSYENEEIVIKL